MPRHPRPRNTAETLAAVAPLVTRWMERVLASADPPLSLGQYLGLRAIAAGVDSAADLARATGVSESAVSQLVVVLVPVLAGAVVVLAAVAVVAVAALALAALLLDRR